MKLPKVSVIIPAYNEEKSIGKCLSSIDNLNYPKDRIETILIDDGSTDNTREIVSKFNVKIIKGEHKGVGSARNLGIKKASNEIIIFIDSDETINKNFIIETVKPFKIKKIVGVDSSYKLVNSKSIIAKLHFLRHILGMKQYDSPYPKICRKKTIEVIGGIKQKFGYYDDWDFMIRIKKKGEIIRVNEAICGKIEPENIREMWRQNKWAGRSIVKLFSFYKKEVSRKLLFPILCAPIPIYFLFLFTPLKFLGILGILIFLLIEVRRSIGMYKAIKWKEAFLTPFFDILTMDMYCIGILLGIFNWKSIPKA